MKIKKLPTFKRPREKLVESGISSLNDMELVALLLRSGYKDKNALLLAKELLPSKTVRDLQKSSFEDLRAKKGIGLVRAASLVAACEFAKRMTEQTTSIPITDTVVAIQQLAFIQRKRQEHFVVLYLNARRELITSRVISIGSVDASIVHPREVFAPALRHNATAVIVGHNHPSGSPDPSHADILLTKRLVQAGQILGITVVDHIILGEKGVMSFREHELM